MFPKYLYAYIRECNISIIKELLHRSGDGSTISNSIGLPFA
jgi:hypothetical protein